MAVIRVPRQHSVNKVAQQILDALRTQGEPCYVLHMYHASIDEGLQPRCHVCYNSVYKATDSTLNCSNCYGTTFEGGIKGAYRIFGIFTDNTNEEIRKTRGEWTPDDRNVQLPYLADLMTNDYVVRVETWDENDGPDTMGGYYRMGTVKELSLRDGSRYGKTSFDRISSSAPIHLLPPNHIIRNWVPENALSFDYDDSTILPSLANENLSHPLEELEGT